MTAEGAREMDGAAVANALRAQAPAALRELLRGVQAADRRAGREHLVYSSLVSALVRMAFVRFAEGHGLQHAAGSPRILDPGASPFLDDRAEIAEGVVLRALEPLLAVAGAGRDVEHLGAIYEGLLGFEVRAAEGRSVALLPHDTVVDVDALATVEGPARIGALAAMAAVELRRRASEAVRKARSGDELLTALRSRVSPRQPETIAPGALFLQPGEDRRRAGAHYTGRAITKVMVARTLASLLPDGASAGEILALKVCDPSMGSGAFLVEACRQLADHLAAAWARAGEPEPTPARARRLVAERCLYGVDRDPLAVDVARLSLWLLASAGADLPAPDPSAFLAHALRHADSLVGLTREQIVADGTPESLRDAGDLMLAKRFGAADQLSTFQERHLPFHWEIELPEVFADGRGGFDAMIGNPPWVSYAGRAVQPLAGDLRRFYASTSPAFFGYRNLQGVFVHRAATLLRPGGRLGLVLPTSMSDLGGYEPSRRAHDALCACDDDLPDFGDRAFEGVFQPSMGLLSTRRSAPVSLQQAGPWPLRRDDLDAETLALLARLDVLPKLPPHLFGERGFQTVRDDVTRLQTLSGPEGAFTTGLRVGGDIEPFLRRPPQRYCDPGAFEGRFRSEADWRSVKLLIRQTARYPMVAPSDGQAFRNSILAGFADEAYGAGFLLAYLNATVIRFYHYLRQRDARQGMPQMKIAHLRALPAPPRDAPAVAALEELGRALGERNTGASAEEQARIDGLAADALGLDDAARTAIAAWAARVGA